MKVVENLIKKVTVKNSFIEKTYAVGTHWRNVYLQHMVLKIRKKIIWKFTFSKYHENCHYLFQTSQNSNQYLNSGHSTANCLNLHDSYISKFEFMNYLFANLLVAWLYISVIHVPQQIHVTFLHVLLRRKTQVIFSLSSIHVHPLKPFGTTLINEMRSQHNGGPPRGYLFPCSQQNK